MRNEVTGAGRTEGAVEIVVGAHGGLLAVSLGLAIRGALNADGQVLQILVGPAHVETAVIGVALGDILAGGQIIADGGERLGAQLGQGFEGVDDLAQFRVAILLAWLDGLELFQHLGGILRHLFGDGVLDNFRTARRVPRAVFGGAHLRLVCPGVLLDLERGQLGVVMAAGDEVGERGGKNRDGEDNRDRSHILLSGRRLAGIVSIPGRSTAELLSFYASVVCGLRKANSRMALTKK